MFFPLLAVFLLWLFMDVSYSRMLPWLNKRIFSRIWSEETRPAVAREAIDRLKELCIDSDVPEETAILMAARENGVTEREMLASFNAEDAAELMRMLSGRRPNFGAILLKKMKNMDRVGMRK